MPRVFGDAAVNVRGPRGDLARHEVGRMATVHVGGSDPADPVRACRRW